MKKENLVGRDWNTASRKKMIARYAKDESEVRELLKLGGALLKAGSIHLMRKVRTSFNKKAVTRS